MRYSCYHLIIESDISLPELEALHIPHQLHSSPKTDITIKVNPYSDDSFLDTNFIVQQDYIHFNIEGVATYLITKGSQVEIFPEKNADPVEIRLYLLGSALGTLLYQRNLLVLHANAIRIGDKCLICMGPSGIGKSTLAAAFHMRGFDLLADDVVAIDQDQNVLPGFPRIKLWEESINHLLIDPSELKPIRTGMPKFNVPLNDGFYPHKLPIRWVYQLSKYYEKNITINPIVGLERYPPFYHNSYRSTLISKMGMKKAHLKQCSELARHVYMAKVSRPESEFQIDDLLESILDDINKNP